MDRAQPNEEAGAESPDDDAITRPNVPLRKRDARAQSRESESLESGPVESPKSPTSPSTSSSPPRPSAPSPTSLLPPEPSWVAYDAELERLCRIAAHVGGSQPAPISYTALIIAFMWADDAVSAWLRDWLSANTAVDQQAIYRSKDVSAVDRERFVSLAVSGELPAANPLYSRSARNLMDQASRIAREVALVEPQQLLLGARHLMAAYAFRNPSDHVDQVRGWGFDAASWQRATSLQRALRRSEC
jgi:hypothetical protein